MEFAKLGSTGLEVSVLGLGTVKFGRSLGVKYPDPYAIPGDRQLLNILDCAADVGINLLDTAPAYGASEERLGQLLKRASGQWLVSTKVGEIFDPRTGLSSYNFSPEFIRASVENSLQLLGLDHLDIVLLHSNGDDEDIILKQGGLDSLAALKQEGLIRATGMSTKTVAGGILAASRSDVVMVTHNLDYRDEVAVIDYAGDRGVGVFIKKALSSGNALLGDNLAEGDIVQQSFDCIYQHQGVSSIVLGSINPAHIVDNAKKAIASYCNNQL
ncbi:aldo/keto reductase [Porticoccaceae bacterium]|nr:aldo/keto reductase [Porticoccaceae bacterium]